MKNKDTSKASDVLSVPRTKEEAKRLYDRISRIYDLFTWAFEQKYANMALSHLSIKEDETALEIGFGTGHCLKSIAKSVGQRGRAYGIDISTGMFEATKRRLEKAGLMDRVELYRGDAAALPYDDNIFDAVFMSFTLELFDTPEIPKVLNEIKRVLKPNGRLGVASMSRDNGQTAMLRLYEWVHRRWPKYVDCRPIYLKVSLRNAGYKIRKKEKVKLLGLPSEIVVAIKPS